jgi:hypothetical protein
LSNGFVDNLDLRRGFSAKVQKLCHIAIIISDSASF